jgi:hypothetical protein
MRFSLDAAGIFLGLLSGVKSSWTAASRLRCENAAV